MNDSRKLSKSNIVQKSFRIEYDLNSALELLSKKLNRSQNELFNVALSHLINDMNNSYNIRFSFTEHDVRLLIAALNIALEFMENHNDDTSEYETLKSNLCFVLGESDES